MASPLTRIFSDLHFGNDASSLRKLASLSPLLDGADAIVLNGDTIETRPGPNPEVSIALRAEVDRFFRQHTPPVVYLTGNHDPDISAQHHLDFDEARLFVTHGDVLFESLVPWSQDAHVARELVARELARLAPHERHDLPLRLVAYRRAAAAIPLRHPSNSRGLKHLVAFAKDTVWPPSRIFRIFRAWHEAPRRAESFLREYRPHARFFAMGHTHRLGAARTSGGIVVLNTGSFCPPGTAGVIDLTADRVTLRRVERSNGEFRLGRTLAAFSLARG